MNHYFYQVNVNNGITIVEEIDGDGNQEIVCTIDAHYAPTEAIKVGQAIASGLNAISSEWSVPPYVKDRY